MWYVGQGAAAIMHNPYTLGYKHAYITKIYSRGQGKSEQSSTGFRPHPNARIIHRHARRKAERDARQCFVQARPGQGEQHAYKGKRIITIM